MAIAEPSRTSALMEADSVAGVASPAAFSQIFAENARFVWRALLGLGVAQSDVQDLSQQVFLVLHKRLADFDGTSSVRTFIYGICLRVASEYRRRFGRRRERCVDELPEQAIAATQLRSVATRQALERLERTLSLLAPEQRDVFVLFEVEELSMAETARAVGCPLFTAYARLRRAREIIAAEFNEAWIAEGPDPDGVGSK